MNKPIKKTPAETEVLEQSITTVPQTNDSVKNIETWTETRANFIKNVVSIMHEGKDFHKIKFGGKEVQVLAKGGAEKVASALGWKAEFVKDSETYEMLGSPAGTLCYICNLKNGEFVGQGRGARNIKQDSGDVNKAIKMAQKSAFIDATLRASGLSDLFTQDLEQGQEEQKTQDFPPSEKQLALIEKLMMDKDVSDEMVLDQGFDLKHLTGGKEGTASELIEWLFAYNTRQFTEKPDYSIKNTPDVALGIRIDKTDSLESLNLLGKEISLAYKNKKITKSQFEILVSVGAKRRAELEAKDPGIVNPDSVPFN